MNGEPRTAVVIGAGIGGLVAAAYLARGGAKVTVLEARNAVGGSAETAMLGESFRVPMAAHAFHALDKRMMRELKLHRHGLKFAERDMPLVALRPGGNHLVLARDVFAARGAIKTQAPADADAYVKYRRELFGFARALRPLWFGETAAEADGADPIRSAARASELSATDERRLQTFARTSAIAHLDRWFENDALKGALSFDACLEGASPQEAGTALMLAWRAAQEMGGLQGATAQFRGGPGAFAEALAKAAQEAGAEIRTGARVAAIVAENKQPAGVTLASGEVVRGAIVLSSLGRAQTLDLLPPEAVGLGAAARAPHSTVGSGKVMLGLNGPLPVAGLPSGAERGRLIVAERPESAAEAKGAALAGTIPAELVLEVTIPSNADNSAAPIGQHVASVLVPFLPVEIAGGWDGQRGNLLKRVVATLEGYAPGLKERIVESEVLTPADLAARYGNPAAEPAQVPRVLAAHAARVRTPMRGLYLCGGEAEPANAVSGTAGRVAATLALSEFPSGEGVAP